MSSSKTAAGAAPDPEAWSKRVVALSVREAEARAAWSAFSLAFNGLKARDLTWENRFDMLQAQAAKIAGLRLQITQMKRGYEREIARLQTRVAALEAAGKSPAAGDAA